jgi:hypothetical protein
MLEKLSKNNGYKVWESEINSILFQRKILKKPEGDFGFDEQDYKTLLHYFSKELEKIKNDLNIKKRYYEKQPFAVKPATCEQQIKSINLEIELVDKYLKN